MMPVQQQPEPADFGKRVRTLGKKFLDTNPNLNGKDAWKNKEYWRDEKSFNDLCDAYNNLCAYTGIWIPIPPNGSRSVDHFIPKSIVPEQAYEWSNFRLTSQRMNTWKGIHQDILDPFQIDDNLFFLDFLLLEVKPNPRLSQELQSAILTTTERLKLNRRC